MLNSAATSLLACLLLMVTSACAVAADAKPEPAQDLTGCAFTVRAVGDEHKKDPATAITFDATTASGKLLGDAKVTYTVKRKKKSPETTFEGTGTTSDGTTVTIEGAVDGKAIHGSVTRRPKDKPAEAVNFSGTMSAGTPKRKA
ncbi:MAG: hypothetical protein H0X38_11120 [Planctomycetes bacterium]|nr:hypothetical protein [Planctomycetota bacterium]